MPRIRTLKPECWRNAKVRRLSREARLFWVVLITQCDDHGRFQFLPSALIGDGYPADEDVAAVDVRRWMTEVENAGLAVTYQAGGDLFGAMHEWELHQKVSKPTESRIPGPPMDSRGNPGNPGEVIEGAISAEFMGETAPVLELPGNPRESLDDHGPRTTDRGSWISGGGSAHDVYAALDAAGFDALTVEQSHSAIRTVLSEFNPPADVDWFAFGQRMREKRTSGEMRTDRPAAALKFMFKGLASLPRLGQTQPAADQRVAKAIQSDNDFMAAIQAAEEAKRSA